jgi:hypothetical protein
VALLRTEPIVEHLHALLGTIGASKPDRPAALQVADDNAVVVTFADRDLVYADHFGSWRAGARQLRDHVLHVQLFDRVPMEVELFRHILDRSLTATPADKERKALGVEPIVGQELELLAFHFAGRPATYAPHFELEVYARVAAREVAYATDRAVVPAVMQASTTTAARFFKRRLSLMMRAFGSPKMPRTVASGLNPGNAYASHKRRFRALQADIRNPRQVFEHACTGRKPCYDAAFLSVNAKIHPHYFVEDP